MAAVQMYDENTQLEMRKMRETKRKLNVGNAKRQIAMAIELRSYI